MTTPRISVIMPCFNAAATIERSVRSALDQTLTDLELIVVDDGSTDDSVAILHRVQTHDSRLIIIEQRNRGAGPARNAGITRARGSYIAFLDSDDTWEPDCLECLLNGLQQTPDASLAYCGWQNTGKPAAQCRPFVPPDYEVANKTEIMLRGCRWPIHAALTSSEVIRSVGGFNENWTSCMDYDLWLRIAPFHKIVLVPRVLAYYHHHGGVQITKNRLRIALNHFNVQREFLQSHPEIATALGADTVAAITFGELLHRAFVCYWAGDLSVSHTLFRKVLLSGAFNRKDLKYLLPSLLPFGIYQQLIRIVRK